MKNRWTQLWSLQRLTVRKKVAAALALPLLIALAMGVLNVSTKVSEARALARSARYVELPSTLADLAKSNITLATAQASGLVTDPMIADLRAKIAAAQAAGADDDVPGGKLNYSSMLDTAQLTLRHGKAELPSIQLLEERVKGVTRRATLVQSVVLAEISDRSVEQAKVLLANASSASTSLTDEVIAMLARMRGEKDAAALMQARINGERALLTVLAANMPENSPIIPDLIFELDNRSKMLNASTFPVFDMIASVQRSADMYAAIVNDSSRAVIKSARKRAAESREIAIRDGSLIGAAFLATLLLAFFVARSLITPLRRLRAAAQEVADHELPEQVKNMREQADPDSVAAPAMPIDTEEEIGQLARTIESLHGQALRQASGQAQLRLQINDMFDSLARRNKTLIDRQLMVIEGLESKERDPDVLESLFQLDHLATRMRRNGENLLILAGAQIPRLQTRPLNISDIVHAAMSEVEEYQRVKIVSPPEQAVNQPAASDIVHLTGELIDNALRASAPAKAPVVVAFSRSNDSGLIIKISDNGSGLPAPKLVAANALLRSAPEVSAATSKRMGLFVVSRLAQRHKLTVSLAENERAGVTASVHIPIGLLDARSVNLVPAEDIPVPAGMLPLRVPGTQFPVELQPDATPIRTAWRTPAERQQSAAPETDEPDAVDTAPQRRTPPPDTTDWFSNPHHNGRATPPHDSPPGHL